MNYFAHALPFLDQPYFGAATGVPDWLTVADRNSRVRLKLAEPFLADADPVTAAVAGGVAQHLRDDLRFHATRAFIETTLELSAEVRRMTETDAGFRTHFAAHLLVEVLLDATLTEEHPEKLNLYYLVLDSVDEQMVQQAVNRMSTQPTARLAPFIFLFRQERILWDYLEDGRLVVRLNQVMRRVGFAPLPDGFAELLPAARALVRGRRRELLDGIPA
jgi:hypothetical protein